MERHLFAAATVVLATLSMAIPGTRAYAGSDPTYHVDSDTIWFNLLGDLDFSDLDHFGVIVFVRDPVPYSDPAHYPYATYPDPATIDGNFAFLTLPDGSTEIDGGNLHCTQVRAWVFRASDMRAARQASQTDADEYPGMSGSHRYLEELKKHPRIASGLVDANYTFTPPSHFGVTGTVHVEHDPDTLEPADYDAMLTWYDTSNAYLWELSEAAMPNATDGQQVVDGTLTPLP